MRFWLGVVLRGLKMKSYFLCGRKFCKENYNGRRKRVRKFDRRRKFVIRVWKNIGEGLVVGNREIITVLRLWEWKFLFFIGLV